MPIYNFLGLYAVATSFDLATFRVTGGRSPD